LQHCEGNYSTVNKHQGGPDQVHSFIKIQISEVNENPVISVRINRTAGEGLRLQRVDWLIIVTRGREAKLSEGSAPPPFPPNHVAGENHEFPADTRNPGRFDSGTLFIDYQTPGRPTSWIATGCRSSRVKPQGTSFATPEQLCGGHHAQGRT